MTTYYERLYLQTAAMANAARTVGLEPASITLTIPADEWINAFARASINQTMVQTPKKQDTFRMCGILVKADASQ